MPRKKYVSIRQITERMQRVVAEGSYIDTSIPRYECMVQLVHLLEHLWCIKNMCVKYILQGAVREPNGVDMVFRVGADMHGKIDFILRKIDWVLASQATIMVSPSEAPQQALVYLVVLLLCLARHARGESPLYEQVFNRAHLCLNMEINRLDNDSEVDETTKEHIVNMRRIYFETANVEALVNIGMVVRNCNVQGSQ